jgi:hypothetical protein
MQSDNGLGFCAVYRDMKDIRKRVSLTAGVFSQIQANSWNNHISEENLLHFLLGLHFVNNFQAITHPETIRDTCKMYELGNAVFTTDVHTPCGNKNNSGKVLPFN